MGKSYLIMNVEDNCATTIEDIEQGKQIQLKENVFSVNENIKRGHKFALKQIAKGDYIKKYGYIIGIATEHIQKGDWIHTHNIKSKYLEDVNNE